MLRARYLSCAVVVCACAASSSRLDQVTGSDAPASPAKPAHHDDDDGAGFDLRGMLAKASEALSKPGHYEAPNKSPGFDAKVPHWAVLQLAGHIVERQSWSITGSSGTELRALSERLRELGNDDELTGVILRFDHLAISLPDVVELHAAFDDLRKAGKQIACHAEGASNAEYLALAACDRIGLAPLGDLAITGPSAMPVHIKPLLDKLGVQADFLHVGAYKGAAEPLTRDAPSKEMQETLGAILDRRYQTMVERISADRKLPAATVRSLIDTALFPSEAARAAKLVDEVASFEAFRDAATHGAPWREVALDPGKSNQMAMVMKVSRFLGAVPLDKPFVNHVAVVYAIGSIIDGDGDGVLGARQQIAAQTLVAALRALTSDNTVKAVVLRIDSGGGSAQASELIWRAVEDLKATKPVIVSMSDVAASGGYYIACGATKIFALDDTLTGSIGVIGGKLAPRDALTRLGVNTFPIGRGKRATITASLAPWSTDERQAIQGAMQEVYGVFVGRVAKGRNMTAAQVEAIAQGRVWTGEKAKQLGLIDEIGGLDAAIAEARERGQVDPVTDLEIYPPAPTLRDLAVGFGQVQAPLGASADAALAALASVNPDVAVATEHLVRLVYSFRSAMVQAVAMLPVLP